jgi:hypothetical protein
MPVNKYFTGYLLCCRESGNGTSPVIIYKGMGLLVGIDERPGIQS